LVFICIDSTLVLDHSGSATAIFEEYHSMNLWYRRIRFFKELK
jgi:hypothetical protein